MVVSLVEVVEAEVEVAFQAEEARQVGALLAEDPLVGAIDLQECPLVAHSEAHMGALAVLLVDLIECTEMVVDLHSHYLICT